MTEDWRKQVKMVEFDTGEAYRPGWDALVEENVKLRAALSGFVWAMEKWRSVSDRPTPADLSRKEDEARAVLRSIGQVK